MAAKDEFGGIPVATDEFGGVSTEAPAPAPSTASRVASDLGKSLKSGVLQLPGQVAGLADVLPALTFGARPFTKAANAIGEATGFQPGKAAKAIEYSPEAQASQAEIDQAWKDAHPDLEGVMKVGGAYLRNPAYTANQVVQSLPAMVAGGVGSRLLMGAGAVAARAGAAAVPGYLERAVGEDLAAPIAGGVGEGAQQTGQQMDQDSELPDQRKNAIAALGSGVVDAAIGAGAGRVANALGLETAQTLMAGGARPSRVASAGGVVKRIAAGAANEGVLQELPQSAQEQAFQNYAEDKPLTEGVGRQALEGAIAGGVLGAGSNVTEHAPQHAPAPAEPPPGPLQRAALALPAPVVRVNSEGDARMDGVTPPVIDEPAANVVGRAPIPPDAGPMVRALGAPTVTVDEQGTARTADQRTSEIGAVRERGGGQGRNSEPDLSIQVQDGDILSDKGAPFTGGVLAARAAKQAGPGHTVAKVEGGYVVRRLAAADDVTDVEAKPVSAPSVADKAVSVSEKAPSDAQTAPTAPAPAPAPVPAPRSQAPAPVAPGSVATGGPGPGADTDAALKGASDAQRSGESAPAGRVSPPESQPGADRVEPPAVSSAPAAAPSVGGRDAGAAPAKPLTLGITPNNAEPVSVKDGVVHVGSNPAVDFDSGEPVKVPEGATHTQIKQAMKDAGAVSRRQKFFGGEAEAAVPASEPVVTPSSEPGSQVVANTPANAPASAEAAVGLDGEKGAGSVAADLQKLRDLNTGYKAPADMGEALRKAGAAPTSRTKETDWQISTGDMGEVNIGFDPVTNKATVKANWGGKDIDSVTVEGGAAIAEAVDKAKAVMATADQRRRQSIDSRKSTKIEGPGAPALPAAEPTVQSRWDAANPFQRANMLRKIKRGDLASTHAKVKFVDLSPNIQATLRNEAAEAPPKVEKQPVTPQVPVSKPAPDRPAAVAAQDAAKPVKWSKAALEDEAKRAAYFTPGNIVRSFGGFDEVLDYHAPTSPSGAWSVTVQEVKEVTPNNWVRQGKPHDMRQHSTQPEAREFRQGPVARVHGDVTYSQPRADGKPFTNVVPRKAAPQRESLAVNDNVQSTNGDGRKGVLTRFMDGVNAMVWWDGASGPTAFPRAQLRKASASANQAADTRTASEKRKDGDHLNDALLDEGMRRMTTNGWTKALGERGEVRVERSESRFNIIRRVDGKAVAEAQAYTVADAVAKVREYAATGEAAARPAQVVPSASASDKAEIRPVRREDGSIGYEAVPIAAPQHPSHLQDTAGPLENVKPPAAAPAPASNDAAVLWNGMPPPAREALLRAHTAAKGKSAARIVPMLWRELDDGWKQTIARALNDQRRAAVDVQQAMADAVSVDHLSKDQIDQVADILGVPSKPAKPAASANTIFTEDAAAAARAILKKKLGTLNSTGLDPEMLQAGITLAGYHIEKGARSFAAYAKAMIDDLGEVVRPYLKSWYMAVKYDPRAAGIDGMDDEATVRAMDAELRFQAQEAAPSDAAAVEKPVDNAHTEAKAPDDSAAQSTTPAIDSPLAPAIEPGGIRQTAPVRGTASPRREPGRADAADVREPGAGADAGANEGGHLGDGSGHADLQDPAAGNLAEHRERDLAGDYRAPVGGLTREGSWFTTAKRNIDLIDLALSIEKEGRAATPAEQEQLSKYVGFGAGEIRNNLFPVPPAYEKKQEPNRLIWPDLVRDARWKPLAERMEALPREWQQSVLQSTQYAHYTGEGIVRGIWSAVQRMGFTGGKVLEPGMGTGNFAMAMPEELRRLKGYTGIEFDGPTALIARLLSPAQNMLHEDFIKRKLPRDFFDMAIGNPPFSQTKILGDPDYEKHGFMLHDFFFAKSIDRVRPGGLLVFVTSKGTMDKQSDKARKYLSDRADLLGAIRLPSTAFEANAGTSVVTDVIFLRKRAEGEAPAGQAWGEIKTVDTKDGPVAINQYYDEHPDMVLGQHRISGNQDDEGRRINSNGFGGEKYTVVSYDKTPAELEAKFAQAVEKLPQNVFSVLKASSKTIKDETRRADFDPLVKREGVIYLDRDGKTLMRVEGGVGRVLGESMKLSDKEAEWFKGYVGVRDQVQLARQAQVEDADWEQGLKALNKAYDAFRKKHGPINDFRILTRKSTDEDGHEVETAIRVFKNNRLLREDYDRSLMMALETIDESGAIKKSPFLLGRTIGKPQERQIKTIGDALAVSLDENGHLDLDDVADRLKISRQDAIEALGNQVYQSTAGDWQLADEYLSGDVVAKLEEATAAAQIDPSLERNVEALKAVQPDKLGPSQIAVKLGASWVPAEYVNEFAQEIEAGPVSFDPKTESWQVQGGNERSGRKAGAAYGTADRSPAELLEAALNSRAVKVTRTVDKKTVTDPEATTAAIEALRKIKERFKSWVWTDSERAATLVEEYNKRFNNIAPRRFDGSHLTLPGVSLRFKLHPHQLRAIWRQVQTGDTYLAHAVGAGKTIEMIAGGMEQKRLGLIKKPMYAVPNHMLEQFSNEFMELYPLANIMVADDENFSAERRRAFVAAATLNAPDAIVITHSAFERIGVKEETVAPIRDEILNDLEAELADAEKGDRVRRSQLQQQIEAVTQRFDRIIGAGGKDSTVKFEDIGADFVYVDEAHAFRKLDFTTNQKLKGIDPNGSKRALDMYVKTRYLEKQRPGRAMVFASGTPVTNTMGELYTIMRFFQPQELDKAGIATFDSWSRMFGEAVASLEANAAGRYETVERFAKFDNVPELMSRVRQFMDVLTSEHLGALVKRPDIRGGKPDLIMVEATDALKTYMKNVLVPRLEASRKWKPSKAEPFNPDPVIAITSDGRFAALDPRFFGAKVDAGTPTKMNEMADRIAAEYKATKDNVYVDRADNNEPVKGSTQIVFYNLGFGAASQANRGFNARAALTKRLIDQGVHRDHILWFDDANTDAKKEAMFEAMRSGKARILIGSAKKMGTGVNVQKRLSKLHYFDPPWFPSDVEQPMGRIIRQGNQNEEVGVDWYATKGTYDSTMWQMVGRKQRFIDQAFTGDKSMRSMDDMSEASQYEQAAALASGDPRALQLAGLRQDVERLERLQAAHANEQIAVRSNLRSAQWHAESAGKRIEQLATALKAIGENYLSFKSGTVQGRSYDKMGEFGQALKDAFNKKAADYALNPGAKVIELGEVAGQPIRMHPEHDSKKELSGFELTVNAGDEYTITVAQGLTMGADVDAVGLARRFLNRLNEISTDLMRAKERRTENENDATRLGKKLGAPFEYTQELGEKIGDLKRLEDELRAEGAADAAQPVSPDIKIDADGIADGEAGPDTTDENPAQFSKVQARRGADVEGPMTHTAVQEAVSQLTRDWLRKPQIEIIDSMNDAPAVVRHELAAQNSQSGASVVHGFHLRGTVYIVADAVQSFEDVRTVLFHEALGHFGLRGVFGKALAPMLHDIIVGRRFQVAQKAKAYGLDLNKESDRLMAAEEVLAELAQTRPDLSIVQRAIAAIRTWLRDHVPGFGNMALSDAEIINTYILPARGFVERGRSGKPSFTRGLAFSKGPLSDADRKLAASFGGGKNFLENRRQAKVAKESDLTDLPDEQLLESGTGEGSDSAMDAMIKQRQQKPAFLKVGATTRQYTPAQEAAMKNVGFEVERPTMKERAKALWQDAGKKLAQGIVDQFAPVKDLDKQAYGLLRLAKGAAGAFEAFLRGGQLKLTDGVYDFDDSKKGGVVDKLLIPLGGEHHDFMRWVAANRAERLAREGKENLFSPADIAALKTLDTGVTSFDYTLRNAVHGVAAGTVTRDRTLIYRDSLAIFNEFNKNALDMAEQSGLIDGASRHLWEHEFYVPFYRVADEADGGVRGMNIKGGVVRQEAFKALKGGKGALNADLLDNTLMNWAHLLDAAAKNRAAKATLDAAERMGLAISAPQYTAQSIAAATASKNGLVWVMDGGVKRYYVMDQAAPEAPFLMTALSALEYAGMRNPVMNAMGAFKHALTLGVTASPFFKVRNLIRDSVQAIGTGPLDYNPLHNIAQGWKLTNPHSDAYFRLLAGGGTIHFGTMFEGSEARRVQALVESGVKDSTILNSDHKVKAFFRHYIEPGISAYNELGNRGEAINRASLYAQLTAQGMNHAEASLQARDLMDFSMQGSFTTVRFLTQVVPFFNARVQGLYKLGRAGKEDPKRLAAVLGATALFSIALLAAYSGDDDWKKREDWDRNNYWWFKFGGTAFRIPKPFEIGAIATLAERGFELAFDKEMTGPRFLKQVQMLMGDNLSLNPIPQLVKPVLDVYANVDSFTNRPIESLGMERLKPEYRFTDSTSMLARGASTAMNAVTGAIGQDGLSPVQIDHLLRGYFGWLGAFVIGASDAALRPVTGQPERAAPDYWRDLTGGMASDLRDAPSRYVSQMYTQANAVEQAYGTWKGLQKQGKTADALAFRQANAKQLAQYHTVERLKRVETGLNQQMRIVEASNVPAGIKRERLRVLQQQKDRIARNLTP